MHYSDWNKTYQKTNGENCRGKKVFASFAEGSAFNNHTKRALRGSKRREKMRVYRCNNCRQWHIGHAPKLRSDRLKRRGFLDERI
jgi:hypothetical protein